MKRYLCLIAILSLPFLAGKIHSAPSAVIQPKGTVFRGQQVQPQKLEKQTNSLRQDQLPPPEGRAFLTYISVENPYKHWELWPGKSEMFSGVQPDGDSPTTYVNDLALQAVQQTPGKMPYGAIIVKENYTSIQKPTIVTAIYKVEGFNPAADDWYWIKFTLEGQIQEEGKVESCISCHSRARDNDFLFSGKISWQEGQ
ncbi:MAG: cytochrome P460 family protein [Deltaproteobacteria bacterium]|jgi:hypothetical protein